MVAEKLDEIIDAIHERGGIAGIHCCGNADWPLIFGTRVCHTQTREEKTVKIASIVNVVKIEWQGTDLKVSGQLNPKGQLNGEVLGTRGEVRGPLLSRWVAVRFKEA